MQATRDFLVPSRVYYGCVPELPRFTVVYSVAAGKIEDALARMAGRARPPDCDSFTSPGRRWKRPCPHKPGPAAARPGRLARRRVGAGPAASARSLESDSVEKNRWESMLRSYCRGYHSGPERFDRYFLQGSGGKPWNFLVTSYKSLDN